MVQVEIQEVLGTVRAVDGDSLLAPHTLNRIVTAVLRALQDVEAHRLRTVAETRVTGGVVEEQRKDGCCS
jgi:hypothetical protein